MQSLQANQFTPQEAGEQKVRRERKSKSPKQPREKGEKKEKVPKERKPQEPWKQSRKVFNDILKVKAFVEANGGE